VDLLLALAFALGFAALTSKVVLLFLVTADGTAFGELLGATLVGLTNVLGSKGTLLLSLLSKVGGVGLALVLWFRLSLSVGSILSIGFLLFGLGNGLASLLVCELSVAVVAAPTVSSLLLVLSNASPAMTVTLGASKTTTTTGTSTAAATTLVATGSSACGFTRSSATVPIRADIAIPESVLVCVVGLLGAVLVTQPLRDGPWGIGAVALAMPHDGLLNCPCWRVGRPVRVELGIIAQQLIHILGSNGIRHLSGGLKRLSRFTRLDAQFAEEGRRSESVPYGFRDGALGVVVALKRGVDVRLAGRQRANYGFPAPDQCGSPSLNVRACPAPPQLEGNKDGRGDAALLSVAALQLQFA